MTFLHKNAMFEQALDFTSAGRAQVNHWILIFFGLEWVSVLTTAPIAAAVHAACAQAADTVLIFATTMPLPKNPLALVIRM
jgi:hypothetical protein